MANQNENQGPVRLRPKDAAPPTYGNTPHPAAPFSLRTWLLVSLVLIMLGGGAAYMYGKKSAIENSATKDAEIIKTVGTHIILPNNVVPKIGKMINIEQFKNDPFLRQAMVGDYVLFYPYEGRTVKAILWRPNEEKIVDVSLVSIPAPAL